MTYRQILCAVDLGGGSEQVVERATELAGLYSAKVLMLHVVEPIILAPPYELPGMAPLELEPQLLAQARQELGKLGQKYRMESADIMVDIGPTRSVIIATAEARNIDLIVIGSHGRHGMGLLLGSTANAVLHHARCDVMAVRIGPK